MLRSDFSRKAHTNFQDIFFYSMCFFQHIGVKLTSISRKIEVHNESKFHFLCFYRRFQPFQCNKHKNKIILGV